VFHAIWHIKSVFSALAVLQILAIAPGTAVRCGLRFARTQNPKPLFFMGANQRETLH
jgi:hypothetical protein